MHVAVSQLKDKQSQTLASFMKHHLPALQYSHFPAELLSQPGQFLARSSARWHWHASDLHHAHQDPALGLCKCIEAQ